MSEKKLPEETRDGEHKGKGETQVTKKQAISKKSKISKENKEKQNIQGTNDSSIVSKRSVERLYRKCKTDPEFFRYFVHKVQRRSPIINRGYWTRMMAMRRGMAKWIEQHQGKKKVIVNLGCGFDPYAFELMAAGGIAKDDHSGPVVDPETIFVDVDYPDLMKKKVRIIRSTPELCQLTGDELPIDSADADRIVLRTDNYIALSCDLRDLPTFGKTLSRLFGIHAEESPSSSDSTSSSSSSPFSSCYFLFTAEVSITYMTKSTSDALIEWSAKHFPTDHSSFLLLEQLVPAGPDHPFAKTMLAHFKSLNTPLHSATSYPDKQAQRQRFLDRGWNTVKTVDLLDIWYETELSEKQFVESVEEFDEWEEFILFCQHYVVVQATNSREMTEKEGLPVQSMDASSLGPVIPLFQTNAPCHRRFAATTVLDSQSIIIHGGIKDGRENSCMVVAADDAVPTVTWSPSIQGRMAHTLTKLPNGDLLLVGGRLNPSRPLDDCWLYDNDTKTWEPTYSLPEPRFRHSAVSIGDGRVLVYGGTTADKCGQDGGINKAWIIWEKNSGWRHVPLNPSSATAAAGLRSRRSASLSWNESAEQGLLVGGMDVETHDILGDIYAITLENNALDIRQLAKHSSLVRRYGSQMVTVDQHTALLAGGVSPVKIIDQHDFFVEINTQTGQVQPRKIDGPLGFLGVGFGMNIISASDKKSIDPQEPCIVVYSGGCVCFSFGSYWNDTFVSQSLQFTCKQVESISRQRDLESVPEINIEISHTEFVTITQKHRPTIFRNQNLGLCTTQWTQEYLTERIGADTTVVIHESDNTDLNFANRNFEYKQVKFGDFCKKMYATTNNALERPVTGTTATASATSVYLRAICSSQPKDKPSIFREEFPTLSGDVVLPDFLKHIQASHFSSPLRLSSANTAMWLHYDVTANVLCQIQGTKIVRMYPPKDVAQLNFEPGSSSSGGVTRKEVATTPALSPAPLSVFDIPLETHRAQGLHPIEFTMYPGDILYIPAMWLHATKPTTPSVSLNFFWKDLDSNVYGAGKDVYGNKDLAGYENGRRAIKKIADSFNDVPEYIKEFYIQRLAQELERMK